MSAYTQIVLVLGYGGMFVLWGSLHSRMGPNLFGWTGVLAQHFRAPICHLGARFPVHGDEGVSRSSVGWAR
jgi:hypothetical protein